MNMPRFINTVVISCSMNMNNIEYGRYNIVKVSRGYYNWWILDRMTFCLSDNVISEVRILPTPQYIWSYVLDITSIYWGVVTLAFRKEELSLVALRWYTQPGFDGVLGLDIGTLCAHQFSHLFLRELSVLMPNSWNLESTRTYGVSSLPHYYILYNISLTNKYYSSYSPLIWLSLMLSNFIKWRWS